MMADTYQVFTHGTELASAAGGSNQVHNAVSTLKADGASPSQAHVNTLVTNWMSFSGGQAGSAAVFVNVDTTVVNTVSKLRGAFNTILGQALASGMSP